MLRIEIKNGVATSRNVNVRNGRNAGTVMVMVEQEAWAFLSDRAGTPAPYPSRISINLNEGQQPYPPGFYTIAPQSFIVGDFSKLSIGYLNLTPIKG